MLLCLSYKYSVTSAQLPDTHWYVLVVRLGHQNPIEGSAERGIQGECLL